MLLKSTGDNSTMSHDPEDLRKYFSSIKRVLSTRKRVEPTDASIDYERGEITFNSLTQGKVTFELNDEDYQAIADEVEYRKRLEGEDDSPPS